MEDYYKVLGVSEDASADEIKKQFRRLSLKHHPDKGGDSDTFKKINAAYTVLGDSDQRKEYDMKRKFGGRMPMGGGMPGMHGGIPEDMLRHMFGGGGMPGMHFGFNGGNMGPNVRIFRNGVEVTRNQMNRPVPIVKHIEVTLEEAYSGVNKSIEIERWIQEDGIKRTEKETLYVDVYKGIDNNEIIMLKNKGNIISEDNKGDVKIFIKIVNNSEFMRHGLDLVYRRKISLCEALCGFKFNLKLLNGKTVTINNTDSVIKPGYKKPINGYGMERKGAKGRLILEFEIEFPNKIEEAKKEIIKKGLETGK